MSKVFACILSLVILSCNSTESGIEVREKTEKIGHTEAAAKSVIDQWHFFIPEEKLDVEIVEYYPSFTRCNRATDNALAIVVFGLDTLRVIDECPGPKNYPFREKTCVGTK